jgi:hypothetical protein
MKTIGGNAGEAANPFSQTPSYSELREVNLWNRRKYLQFHEDTRPPYNGTWSKRSSAVTGRRPFGREKVLDYSYDSEGEWEEEEPGESVSDVEGDDDEEIEEKDKGAEYNYDDGWLREDDDLGDDTDDEEATVAGSDVRKIRRQGMGESTNGNMMVRIVIGPSFGGIPAQLETGANSEKSVVNKVFDQCGVISLLPVGKTFVSLNPAAVNIIESDDDNKKRRLEDEDGDAGGGKNGNRLSFDDQQVAKIFVTFLHNSTLTSKDKVLQAFLLHPPLVALSVSMAKELPSKKKTVEWIDKKATKIKLESGAGVVWHVEGNYYETVTGIKLPESESSSIKAFAKGGVKALIPTADDLAFRSVSPPDGKKTVGGAKTTISKAGSSSSAASAASSAETDKQKKDRLKRLYGDQAGVNAMLGILGITSNKKPKTE